MEAYSVFVAFIMALSAAGLLVGLIAIARDKQEDDNNEL